MGVLDFFEDEAQAVHEEHDDTRHEEEVQKVNDGRDVGSETGNREGCTYTDNDHGEDEHENKVGLCREWVRNRHANIEFDM